MDALNSNIEKKSLLDMLALLLWEEKTVQELIITSSSVKGSTKKFCPI